MISERGETVEVRTCTKCGNEYPLTTEYWRQIENGQFRRSCRACAREYRREYYAKPEVKERERQYYAENKERIREQRRQYNADPEVKERRRQYNAKPENKERKLQYYAKPEVKERTLERVLLYSAAPENKERLREYRREYYGKPEVKERTREYKREYYGKPEVKERTREYKREYYDKPEVKERTKIRSHKRRAKKRALPVLWNVAIERAIFGRFVNSCAYCGSQQGLFHADKMSWDHYIPLKAGDACPGTVPWNMVPACLSCNSSKNASDPRKWLIERFGKRQGGAKADAIEAHLARMRAEYGGEEPLTPTLPPISGEGGRGEDGRGIVRWS